MLPKPQSVLFSSYIRVVHVFVIRCKVIFISIMHCALNRKLDNHVMCLVLPLCGALAILKNKNVWLLFHCISSIAVLSIYIRTLFYFKIEKNNKERQGNKKVIIWFWGKWLLWDSNSWSLILEASALTTALRKIYNWVCICPIYRQPIFIINLNTDKTVSIQSELLAFLPTL